MTTSIKTCISHNSQLLGVDFTNLGQTKHSFWGGHKIFLSYNNQTGWKVCKLNIFQRFLRQRLGLYKETRFEHVYTAWCKEKKVHADLKKDHPLNVHMKSIWKRCNFAIYGNSSLADARIICLGDIHTDDQFRQKYHKIIKDHYQSGDMILIEGTEAGVIYQSEKDHDIQKTANPLSILINPAKNLIKRVQNYFTPPEKLEQKPEVVNGLVKNLKGKYNIQGWEPIGMKFLKEVFAQTHEKIEQVRKLHNEIMANIPKNENYSRADLEPLKQACKKFDEQSKNLGSYFQINAEELVKYLYEQFQDLENMTLKESTVEDKKLELAAFRYYIRFQFEEFKNREIKARYAHIDPKIMKNLDLAITERNKFMCEEIEKTLLLGKKVFVIGGPSHFLAYSKESAMALAATKMFLNKERFVILSKKSLYQQKYAKHNHELKKVN